MLFTTLLCVVLCFVLCCVVLPPVFCHQVLLTTNEQGARFVKVRVRTICIPQVSTAGRQAGGQWRTVQHVGA
jgi:hypothetical protein